MLMQADHQPTGGTARAPARMRQGLGPANTAVIAMSSTAPTLSIGIGMGVIAGIVGGAIPAFVLLAFLPILGIASAYSQLNRVERNCGAAYSWVGRTLSPWLGFQSGWVILVGTTIYLAYGSQICGALVISFANECHLHSVLGVTLSPGSAALTTILGVTALALFTYLAVRGADIVARFQTPMIIFEYLVLIGFCGYAVAAGKHPLTLAWFNPATAGSAKLLVTGLVVCVYIFWGWDSAFSVTEETRRPRDASRAGYGSLFLMLGMFLLAAIGLERMFSPGQMTAHASTLLPYLGTTLARQPLAVLPLVALVLSAIASLQAAMLPTARNALAMSRDGNLGPVWARLHRRYATPAAGTLIIASAAALLAVLGLGIGTLSQFIGAAAISVGVLVSVYYGLAGLACAVRFRASIRSGPWPALRAVILPGLSGLVLFALGAFLAYTDWTSTQTFAWNAANGRFQAAVPVLIITAGIAASAWAKWGRRATYFRRQPSAPAAPVPSSLAVETP
jgi:amino acid transporter